MRRRSWLWLAVVAVALVAASCGNADDDDAAPATTASSGETADTGSETADTGGETDESDTGGETDSDTGDTGDDSSSEFVPITGVPGVTDDAISYASISLKENNLLGTCILDCYNAGIKAYFDWRNSEGGIYDRELVLSQELDDAFANNQQLSLEVAADDGVFGAFSATLNAAGWGDLNDAGVPTYAWNIHATEFADRPAIIGHFAAACADCTQRGVPYAASLADATKMAALGYGVSENSKVCTQGLERSMELYEPELGIEVAYFNDELAFGLPAGISVEVGQMKDAGVDFIATCMDLNGMKTLAQELDRQGMGDVVMYHPNTYNQEFVAEAGGIFDGDFVVAQFVPWEIETGLELQDEFLEWMDASGAELSELAMIGWINADQAYQALLAAGPDFDQAAVIDGSNQMTSYSAGGLINAIDWTRQHTPPTEGDATHDYELECFSPVRVENGEFVPLGDAENPWLCWDNTTTEWSEPMPTSLVD